MTLEPSTNYFSIWRFTFRLFRQHAGLLICATICMAAPFFILNGLASARHIMTLGGAHMAGIEIPGEQMQLLWAGLVGGDSLAFVALSVALLLVLNYLAVRPETGFARHVRNELPRLVCSAAFWLFAIAQVVVFMMINSPNGLLKIAGMILLGCTVLLLLNSQGRAAPASGRRRRLTAGGWISLLFILLTIPVLYILFNGYVNAVVLMLADLGAQKLVQALSLDLQSPWLPYGVITLSRFFSQWLNLLPMGLLLSTAVALRATGNSEPPR